MRHESPKEIGFYPHCQWTFCTNEAMVILDADVSNGDHRWACQLHQVIHQRITPSLIPMQEAARQIKPSGRERLTRLPFKDGIDVVEDDVGRIHQMARHRMVGKAVSCAPTT